MQATRPTGNTGLSQLVRFSHWRLAAARVPGLLLSRRQRRLLAEMRAFCRELPELLRPSLEQGLDRLGAGPSGAAPPVSEETTRRLADLAALLERDSPLGLCLRRSLVRYHFLRRLELPVVVNFGAKFVDGRADREIAGHAWLTLRGEPYHERYEDWRGFTVMFTWPREAQP